MQEDSRVLTWSDRRWDDRPSALSTLDSALMTVLLEHISTRVAVVGRDMRYLYANREALAFMGLPSEKVIGHHMSAVLDAGVYQRFAPMFERLFSGESLELRGWVQYEKQGRRYREQMLVPYCPGGGAVQSVVVCGLDHTEQRLGEQALAHSNAQLRTSEALKSAIFDYALVALISTDVTGLIVEFNPAAEALFGYSRAQAIGQTVSRLIVPDRYRSAHEQGLQRMQAGSPARMLGRRLEMHAQRADGSEFPMEMMLSRTDAEGATFYTASIADLSARHDAAAQIERQREALRQSEKLTAMGSLLAGVSHELNNPLAIVMGRASLLEEKCAGDAALLHDATRIREAAERCGRIVRTFLNMARSRPARRNSLSLNDAVRAAADMLGYSLRSHNIALRLALAPDLAEISADADQICQIVLNLLVNAQQALSQKSGPRWIELSSGALPPSASGDAAVWLRVADNGPGITQTVRARIFDAFFTTKAEGLGTGMGLSVSRSLAREHGGDLTLEPSGAEDSHAGAQFFLTLPLSQRAGPGPLAVPLPLPDLACLARILVVDDEAELAHVMREMLETAGYEVASAESGAQALFMLDSLRFDAVISDLRMPDMDGAGLWRAIGNHHPYLIGRVLFVTGDTLSPDATEFFKAAGCEGLDKPFSKADLLARVAALLKPVESH